MEVKTKEIKDGGYIPGDEEEVKSSHQEVKIQCLDFCVSCLTSHG